MVMQYQACQVAAESSLKLSYKSTQSVTDRSSRISNYYKNLASCNSGLSSNMDSHLKKWADFSDALGATTGLSTYIDASPGFNSVVSPSCNSKIIIKHSFPSSLAGSMTITLDYEYKKSGTSGSVASASDTKTLSLRKGEGAVSCSVYNDNIDCTYGTQKAKVTARACTAIYPGGERANKAEEQCKGAKLTGTLRFSWVPCESECAGTYTFDPEAVNCGSSGGTGTGSGSSTTPGTPPASSGASCPTGKFLFTISDAVCPRMPIGVTVPYDLNKGCCDVQPSTDAKSLCKSLGPPPEGPLWCPDIYQGGACSPAMQYSFNIPSATLKSEFKTNCCETWNCKPPATPPTGTGTATTLLTPSFSVCKIQGGELSLNWPVVPGANSYEIKASYKGPDFSDTYNLPVQTGNSLTMNVQDLPDLDPIARGYYYFKIRAVGSNGQSSDWSSPQMADVIT